MTTKNAADMTDDELEQAEAAREQETTGENAETTGDGETTTGETGTGETGAGETGTTTETTGTTSTTTEQTGQTGETTTTETTGTAAAETAGAETGKVAGVASKDGTRVLPYSALQAERRSRHQAVSRADRVEKENERLKEEIENLRAGKSTDTGEVTEEEVQRMEADFPEVGAKMRKVFEQNQELAKKVAEAKPSQQEEEAEDDPVQEIIDQVPLLVEWQHDPKRQDLWQRSIEHDALLMKSPKWKDKPPVERFTEAARRTAEEFDIAVPAATSGTQQTSSKQPLAKQTPDPKKAVESAQRPAPSTLSDLKGGAVPDHGQVEFSKMPAQQMLGKFMDMDDAAIDRHLAKLG